MSAFTHHHHVALRAHDWEPDVVQLLDESHLAASSEDPAVRSEFTSRLGRFLGGMGDVDVCTLYGRFVTDLDSFCYQLERSLPSSAPLARRIDGPRGVVNHLRQRNAGRARRAERFRFYIWHDADVLMTRNRELFDRLVDAIMGVAAESEFASEDLLLIHRLVAVGGRALSMYAADASGPFNSWHDADAGDPFWEQVSGVLAPRTQTLNLDELHLA